MGVSKNGWFIRENTIEMDNDLGVTWGYPILVNPIYNYVILWQLWIFHVDSISISRKIQYHSPNCYTNMGSAMAMCVPCK